MLSEIEETLIQCLANKELRMQEGACLIVMSLLTTDKQRGTMIDWISKHYKENPTEDEVIEIAEAINETIQ